MTQGKLASLTIVSSASDILREIDFIAIVNNFDSIAKWRNVSGL